MVLYPIHHYNLDSKVSRTVTIYRPETQTNKLKLTLRNSLLSICHVCLSLSLKWEKWQNSDKNCKIVTLASFMRLCYCFPIYTKGVFTWENLHRCESHNGMTFWFYMMTGSFHVDEIHVWFKIANITHALSIPVYRQTNFTLKWVVVLRLHDTTASFCTGVKFLPRYKSRSELMPGWLAPA